MLSRLKMSIDVALEQYNTVGNEVFAHPRASLGLARPKYKTESLKNALHSMLAKGLVAESRRTSTDVNEIRLKNENTFACHT
jgi:hypothetical protein